MPFENENLFLAAVTKYKRGWPGDTSIDAAILIEDTFIDSSAPRKVPLSVFERAKIMKAVFEYRKAVEKRASLGFFERLVTSDAVKADPNIFDLAVGEVTRNFRMSAVQQATLEMLQQNAHNRMALDRMKGTANAGVHSLTVDQVVDHVRSSEMTINFDASEFFSGKFDPGMRYLHMWERGKTVENDDYAAKRSVTEQAIFCYDHNATQPSDRPYYAGINIGKRTQGSAGNSTYGFSHFVLKEDVKERATFTPSDTFNIASYIITDTSIRNLRGKIPDPVLLQLDAIKDPARKYKSPEFEHLLMDTLKITNIRVVATINEFTRKEGTEWKKIASYDRLERIVRWFSDQQLKAIAEIARNPSNVNQPVADYVEAQIHGAINFSDDIQEMRIADWEIEGDAKCALNMKKFAAKHGLPFKMFGLGDI